MDNLRTLGIAFVVVAFNTWLAIRGYSVLLQGLGTAAMVACVGGYISGRWKLLLMTPRQIRQAYAEGSVPALSPLGIKLQWVAGAIALLSVAYWSWTVLVNPHTEA
jgi:hypothetical protein